MENYFLVSLIGGLLGLLFFAQNQLIPLVCLLHWKTKIWRRARRRFGLASSFGIDLGGGGGSIFTGSNLTELFKSRAMVEQTC
jgi:hypothetical protein